MARIIPKYHKGEDAPYAYSIRVFRGKDENGKELSPYQMTWEVPATMKDEKRIKNALSKVVGEFETDCRRGQVSADNRTVKEYARYYLDISARDNKIKSTSFYYSLLPRIEEELGHIKLSNLSVKDLNKFYLKLQTEDVRKDKKARAKDKFLEIKKERKITHDKLAELTGLSDNTIRSMCQQKNVAILSAEKASEALQCDFRQVFDIVYSRGVKTPGLSPKTIKEYHNFIHGMIDMAYAEGVVRENIADKARPPRADRKEAEFFEIEEILRIREALDQEPMKYKAILYLLIETGMRKGEVLGLKWENIDFDNCCIRVQNNLQWARGVGLYTDSPKNYQPRTINISHPVMDFLKEYKILEDEFKDGRSDDNEEYNPEGWLFHQENGHKAMFPDTVNHWMTKVERKYNLPHLYPHKFRHSQASILIASNVDIVTVSKRLGHKQVSTTQNVYAHLLDKMDEQAAKAVSAAVWDKELPGEGENHE